MDAAFATGGVATRDTHKPWSVMVANSIGFGLQTDAATNYYYGQLSATGSWRFTRNLSLWLNTGLYYTPDPRPNDGRSLDAGGVSLTLRDSRLFKDDRFTGLVLSGAVQVAVPLSMKAFNSLHYPYPSVGLGLALSRKVGEVALRYGISFSKFNPADPVYISRICAAAQPVDTCYWAATSTTGSSPRASRPCGRPSPTWCSPGPSSSSPPGPSGPLTHLAGTGPGVVDRPLRERLAAASLRALGQLGHPGRGALRRAHLQQRRPLAEQRRRHLQSPLRPAARRDERRRLLHLLARAPRLAAVRWPPSFRRK